MKVEHERKTVVTIVLESEDEVTALEHGVVHVLNSNFADTLLVDPDSYENVNFDPIDFLQRLFDRL